MGENGEPEEGAWRGAHGGDGLELPLSNAELLAGANDINFRLGQLIGRSVETAATVFALTEILVRKGILTPEELEQGTSRLAGDLHADAMNSGLTVSLADSPDKYTLTDLPEIDCAERIPLCKAACCRLRFSLSEQDIREGVVEWTLASPYMNRQKDNGYCVHAGDALQCTIYDERPSVCRRYDCRSDSRIWLDFEERRINPGIADVIPFRAAAAPKMPQ